MIDFDQLHRECRMQKLLYVGVEQTGELMAKLEKSSDPIWSDMPKLVVDKDLKVALASQLFKSSNPVKGEKIVIMVAGEGRDIAELLVDLCIEAGVKYELDVVDNYQELILINHLSDEGLSKLAEHKIQKYADVSKTIKIAVMPNPEVRAQVDPDRWDLYQQHKEPLIERIMSGDLFYTLTVLPTPRCAKLDGMSYEDYLRLFFELCDQPWEEIGIAQKRLIAEFNEAHEIRIMNDDGTDITMSLKGHTFANSVIAKNLPGSELFSAPVRESVNGRIVAKGKFQQGTSGIMEDITLVFKDGRVVEASARIGEDDLWELITADDNNGEGSRYIGELGIGTNPHLRRHILNGALVEKIGGSFHVALGGAYRYTEYCGVPVTVDNGNRSKTGVHWDLTTMLRNRGGKIYLDGRLVQDNGDWLNPELVVLNEGWGALPHTKRPHWYNEVCC